MPPLAYVYLHAVEDITFCFQELKYIVQGTEAKVDMDEFNLHSEFCAAWRKLYANFLVPRAMNAFAANMENTIQHLW